MHHQEIQQVVFHHIRSLLPAHISLVDEVAELLQISTDSAYRRIRGEKMLGLDEAYTLCNHYRISLDQLLQLQTNTVVFSGNRLDPGHFGFEQYLDDIIRQLQFFTTLPDPLFYYYNKDIPIFHFMAFPELCAFKIFFWKRTVIGYPELSRSLFTGSESVGDIREQAHRIISLYNSIPSTEIWNEESVHVTLRQIEYCRQSGIFASHALLETVYQQFHDLLVHIELEAEAGRKFLPGLSPLSGTSYDMYINECLIGDNTIYVKGGDRQLTFLNHNGLNFIGTQDPSFCAYTKKNLEHIIRKSTHISVVGEKERRMFFQVLREKILRRGGLSL